jgi:phytanoyl-CoA hydroxylase
MRCLKLAHSTNITFDEARMTDIEFAVIKKNYERDGFVILRGYLSEAEVGELRDRAVPLASAILSKEGNDGRYRNLLKSLHRHDDWFDEKLTKGKHVPLIRYLIDDDVFGASAAWFDRPEAETEGLDPHVDALGRDKDFDTGATIWFALDPVNVGNGCLHYLKGSHLNVYPDTIPIPGIDTESEDVYAAELNPGDAVIHNALTVHWSGGNKTGKPRRAVSYFYFGARAYAAMHKRKEA